MIKNFNDFLNENTKNKTKRMLTEETGDNDIVTEFFFLARNCATQSHYLHLMTDSFAEHTALNEFYDGVIPLIDSFMESFIGRFGKLSDTMPTDTEHLTISEFRGWVETNRDKLTDCSELQNIVDEIISFCDGIIYKLENLK